MGKSKYQDLYDAIEAMEIKDLLEWTVEIDWNTNTIYNMLSIRWPDRIIRGHELNGKIYLVRLK